MTQLSEDQDLRTWEEGNEALVPVLLPIIRADFFLSRSCTCRKLLGRKKIALKSDVHKVLPTMDIIKWGDILLVIILWEYKFTEITVNNPNPN